MGEMASIREINKLFVEEEYATQFHGVSPYSVHETVLTTMIETTDEAVDGLWTFVQKICPERDLTSKRSDMKKKCEDVIHKYSSGILELIQKALFVPSHVLLPEDAVQKQQYSEGVGDLQKKNLELKKQAFYNSKFKKILSEEMELLKCVEVLEAKVIEWEMLCKQFRTETEELKNNLQVIDDLFDSIQTEEPFVVRKHVDIKLSVLDKIGKC